MRSSSLSDEVAALLDHLPSPLVPKFQGDKVAYNEFNGASFSGTVFMAFLTDASIDVLL
ncbi:LOW QUALITY PROTEIN: hypothetical protein YC2023_012031 [Brassica napus]